MVFLSVEGFFVFFSIFSGYVCEREDTFKEKKNLSPFISFLNSLALLLCGVLPSLSLHWARICKFFFPFCKLTFLLGAARSLLPGYSLRGHFWKAMGGGGCSSHLPAKPCVHTWAWILDNVGDSFCIPLVL